jgi:hypothetical protein
MTSEAWLERVPAGDIVLCGSMSAFGTIHRIARELLERGLPTVVPEPDGAAWDLATPQRLLHLKRSASMSHLKRVKAKRTAAVLAINVDRHGVHDYIGPNTFAELALGFAHGKRLYLLQDIPEQYEEELRAWGAVSLDGRLEILVSSELQLAVHPHQLSLFEDWQGVAHKPHTPIAA